MSKTDFLPTLPLRDIVIFPGMIIPLFVGRDKSIKALNEVMRTDKKIILVCFHPETPMRISQNIKNLKELINFILKINENIVFTFPP